MSDTEVYFDGQWEELFLLADTGKLLPDGAPLAGWRSDGLRLRPISSNGIDQPPRFVRMPNGWILDFQNPRIWPDIDSANTALKHQP